MLLVTGTRDALALPALVERHLASLPTVTLVLVADADHSFRRKGTRPEEMLDFLAATTVAWLGRLEGLSGLADVAADPQ